MKFKRLFITLIFITLSVCAFADTRTHLVKPGDTLYSLAKRYEVTVEAIQAANPQIVGTNIPAGMTLVIPDKVGDTKEGKKGFLSNLFKKKNKDGEKTEVADDGENQDITVTNEPTQIEPQEPVQNPFQRVKQPGTSDNIVVILPFNLDSKTATDDRQQMRSVEFYEGFLMAVKEAEENGQRILIQNYDLGTKSMSEILNTQSLMDADMIIAPMELNQVRPIAEFGKRHNINVVSPFVYDQELSRDNKNLIQLNTTKFMLYDGLTSDLLTRFADYDFVFLTDSTNISKADPYAATLRKELSAQGKQFYDFSYLYPERLAKVDSTLHIAGHNILYIPVCNSREVVQKMFPCLQCTTFDPVLGPLSKGTTAILGYPEWVLYTSEFMDYFYDMNVYIFSKFYVNPFDEEVKQFYNDFRYWFAKEPMPLTPRYALLGFDMGRYFLSAVRSFGRDFNLHLDSVNKKTLQSAISFRREGENFINKGLYLVNFTPSTTIEKHEIK